jgi:hypothetical protein
MRLLGCQTTMQQTPKAARSVRAVDGQAALLVAIDFVLELLRRSQIPVRRLQQNNVLHNCRMIFRVWHARNSRNSGAVA